ncbi:mitochondrial carrier domain-containing protein [Paraphysoderma sedebokerense]|nr:mitochondrial carrier domain-containing protein [Paraphysoderma sedebokerense]
MANDAKDDKQAAQPSGLKSFLSGGFGGICLVAAGHPLDLIKVRLQTSNQYKGMMDCARQTMAKEGVRGLYRGMATPLVGVTPVFSVCFWGYDLGQKLQRWALKMDPSEKLSLTQIMIAGGFSAVPTTALMTPMERIKVVLQVQTEGNVKYKGPIDAAKGILKESGIKGLYAGTTATLLRDGIGSVAYFGAYEGFKRALTPSGAKPEDLSPLAVFFAGGMAGMANWAVAIPFDVLKSRLQSAPEGTYSGLRDVFLKTVRNEGAGALFKGLAPAMARAFPANAACFLGVEVSMKVMNALW